MPKPSSAKPCVRRSSPGAEGSARRVGVARLLSKRGHCSRSRGAEWVQQGRIRVDGQLVHDPEHPCQETAILSLDGVRLVAETRLVLMLNKPRGLITTASDEQGRATVYDCLGAWRERHLGPVGRLDKASEGLLLFCNDPAFAATLTDPARHVPKTYHVQIDRLPDADLLASLMRGVLIEGAPWRVQQARELRRGTRHAWLEIVLHEGRNRHIRRLLEALDVGVLRLLRVAIGDLWLGDLPKGAVRVLSAAEIDQLSTYSTTSSPKPDKPR